MTRFLSIYHYLLVFLGAVVFGFPSRKLFVVGVTGTKGKSTTLEIMSAIMESAGKKTALLSTVRRKVGGESVINDGNTMPGRFAIQKFLRDAVRGWCEYALLEVTSQGVLQHRHRFIDWDAACVTHVAPEHVEAHGSFENYLKAKLDFFRCLGGSRKDKRLFFINKGGGDGYDYKLFEEVARGVRGSEVFLTSRGDLEGFDLSNEFFEADFNLDNAALAVSFARSQGVSEEVVREALDRFKGVPGRLEFVAREPFAVVVDYAHTPDSLGKLLSFLRESGNQESGIRNHGGERKRLICVFGSMGGDRDRWKRPEMGKVAAEYCDYIVLTNEDPCDDDPMGIIEEIEKGLSKVQSSKFKVKSYWKVVDRREAIRKAVSLARPGDVVVIAGKGSQQSMTVKGGKKVSWSDRKVALEVLEKG